MDDGGRISRFLRRRARTAGRRYEEARQAYQQAQVAVLGDGIPVDDAGRGHIVCRRYAERRAVHIDTDSRPSCFEADHPDCEGCREDILRERIETWTTE